MFSTTAVPEASRPPNLRCKALLGCLGLAICTAFFAVRDPASAQTVAPRESRSLSGPWLFQREGDPSNAWKTVSVPSSFQSHESPNFHGIGWYRKDLGEIQVPRGRRLLVHFQAAATEAEVWCDGERLGSHLGGWTPFRFDITDVVRKNPSKAHEIRVRLDEKPGHNTQGFLPIIAPHFGGLWQDVSLITVPETYIDDLQLMSIGDLEGGSIRVEFPLVGSSAGALTNLAIKARLKGEMAWAELKPRVFHSNDCLCAVASISTPRLWSPADPALFEIELSLPQPGGDKVRSRAAFRPIEAFGPELRLNGQPLNVRGILNWGYSGPRVEPNPGEAVWRQELEFAKANGFNLMKFCLWVPPPRYLELADELGVLTWMEYPTWHPTLTQKFLVPLRREFREFFALDRNHPSVILRSLTCETGPSAELQVIKDLYDTAHRMIPGALVEDDSSWIQWNRVHDFYDDHPYGNNHTWPKTLADLNEYILAHGIKPLVLGESISADTWVDRQAALSIVGDQRPWWAPAVLDDMQRWTGQMRSLAGPDGLDQLRSDSLRYGMLMRKYQIEAFRREVPYGGYIITVLRDFPKASMGLLDYQGKPKWSTNEWQWQRPTICLLKTDNDRRCFSTDEYLKGEILLSHFGTEAIAQAQLTVTLERLSNTETQGMVERLQAVTETNVDQNCGTLAKIADFDWTLPEAKTPQQLFVRSALLATNGTCENSWPIWVVPTPKIPANAVQVHSSVPLELARELFSDAPVFDATHREAVVVASHFDPPLASFLESGGRVLMLPDGQRHSFVLSSHWFLRGAPYIPGSSLSEEIPREFLVQLQHFDLASQVVPELPQLDSFDPVLMLWDTHDLDRVKTHGLVFETSVGTGKLLVSALRHGGTANPAGRWLLGLFLRHLSSEKAPRHSLPPPVWNYAKARLVAEQTNLVNRTWLFRPDPGNEGLELGWHKPGLIEENLWKDIRIGAWWESQGYPSLDGWAWYRLWVDIPRNWAGKDTFLSFEGVDDIYELYVNGEFAGKGGDLATRKDALTEKKSHSIARFVTPGQKALIAVRVHDWYGAGGIFRPVTLGTLPVNASLDLLR